MPQDLAWPTVLTNADWQKKKGTVAKAAGKSGVGEALTAAERAFKALNQGPFDARNIPPKDRDLDKITKMKGDLGAYHKAKVEPVRKLIVKARDTAEATAKEWKKSKLIPASATKAATDVAKAADQLFITLAGNSQHFKESLKTYDEMIAVKQRALDTESAKLATTIAELEKALVEANKTPTAEVWSEGKTSAHQRCRSMCNAIRNIPKLKAKYWSTWEAFGDEYHRGVPKGDEGKPIMQQKIRTVAQELAKFKASYVRDMA